MTCTFFLDEIGAEADRLSADVKQECCGRGRSTVPSEEKRFAWD